MQAVLYNKGEYTFFQIGKEIIRFLTTPYLERYTAVKEYDNGYIVVESKLKTMDKPQEDYIDMEFVFDELQLDKGILSKINKVVIKHEQSGKNQNRKEQNRKIS